MGIRDSQRQASRRSPSRPTYAVPRLEELEQRDNTSITPMLNAGVLSIIGDAGRDNIMVALDRANSQIVVRSFTNEVGRFNLADVQTIVVNAGDGQNVVRIDKALTQPAIIQGGNDRDILKAGGGASTVIGGPGDDKLIAGPQPNVLSGDGGANLFFAVKAGDTVLGNPTDRVIAAIPVPQVNTAPTVLTTDDVAQLLNRAAAASPSEDAIIVVMDRNGRILGVRAEAGVDPAILNDAQTLTFAVDGAAAKARTGAFFGNNQAPLTSRTVQFISQTTMTQREIESNPNIPDINSTVRGPGFVAPVGIKNHFPPGVMYTPQVDLFAIEHTNRDSIVSPGPDRIRGTPDDIQLSGRFNIDPQFVPAGQQIFAPESYGFVSGIYPSGQSRGIATLPGGIPLFKNGVMVGGIGVFFPGKTGYATEENSSLSTTYNPAKPDRSLEAEWIAFAAAGGSPSAGVGVGAINGVAAIPGFALPSGRIDLVGITLDIFGPGGDRGPAELAAYGRALGVGNPFTGQNLAVGTGANGMPGGGDDPTLLTGQPVPEGWLVMPHDGAGVTAAEVTQIIINGIAQANETRAAIRLPLNSPTKMMLAVTDLNGEVVGLFRMPDATVFSIDVAVAKARNVRYYADPAQLQPQDQLPGVAPGFALTNRSFRYLSLPRFPEGIDGAPPGPFSILNDGGTNPITALQVGARLPASAFQSVQGFDAFNPQSNFHSPFNVANQNGIVFFPGSTPIYRGSSLLIGGFGISGDGVDQDDVVTAGGAIGFEPNRLLRIDTTFVNGIRVPFQKSNRNPEGGITG